MTAFGIERDLVQDVEQMADLVMSAAAAWSNGQAGRAERVIHGIVGELHGEYERAALGWSVTSIGRPCVVGLGGELPDGAWPTAP